MKKKLESRLAQGVRQVKSQTNKPQGQSQHEPESAPAHTASMEKSASRAVQPPAANPVVTRSDDLHPQRVWPD